MSAGTRLSTRHCLGLPHLEWQEVAGGGRRWQEVAGGKNVPEPPDSWPE